MSMAYPGCSTAMPSVGGFEFSSKNGRTIKLHWHWTSEEGFYRLCILFLNRPPYFQMYPDRICCNSWTTFPIFIRCAGESTEHDTPSLTVEAKHSSIFFAYANLDFVGIASS